MRNVDLIIKQLLDTGRQRVGLAWFSPDCKHHSKAKGGKPVAKNIRDLAWIVVLWAKRARPAVIMLENVEEFRQWGPLTAENKPCPDRRGQTFAAWVRELRRLGYKVEHRELRACDYGAPTIRKRLFLIARCDGQTLLSLDPALPQAARKIRGLHMTADAPCTHPHGDMIGTDWVCSRCYGITDGRPYKIGMVKFSGYSDKGVEP